MHYCGKFVGRAITRRDMLARCANGFGAIALLGLLGDKAFGNLVTSGTAPGPLAPRQPHFTHARAA